MDSKHSGAPWPCKRILFVIGQLHVGGAEKHLVTVATSLKKRGWAPEIFCLSDEGPLATQAREGGVPVFSSKLFGKPIQKFPHWLVRLVGALVSFSWNLAFRRPNIIHFFLPDAYVFGGLCALALLIRPRIMSRRSLNHYQQNRHPWMAEAEHFLHPHMTLVCGNSLAVNQQLLVEGVPTQRLRLIYNGVDCERFSHLPDRPAIRTALGIDNDALVLIMVANIIPYKGHKVLLETLVKIHPQLPAKWSLLLVGRDDGEGNNLRTFAARHGIAEHIAWMGSRTDIPYLLTAADIGIHCSHEEGFSNAILEGMAAGLPMIVTNVGGNPEAVQDGHTGIVVPTDNPDALGEGILYLAHTPEKRKTLGGAAKERVASEFSLEGCIISYESLYREALNTSE